MSPILSLLAPLAMISSPAPAPKYGPVVRLTGGVGAVLEVRSWDEDQAMAAWSFTPSLRLGHLLGGLEVGLHTTGSNDQKLDLGARLGGALDLSRVGDGSLTFDVGWRNQTRSRLVGGTIFGGSDDQGIDRQFGYAGLTLGVHHHPADGGFVYGFEVFTRFDLITGTRVRDEDSKQVIFGGTAEVGINFKLGLDVLVGQ